MCGGSGMNWNYPKVPPPNPRDENGTPQRAINISNNAGSGRNGKKNKPLGHFSKVGTFGNNSAGSKSGAIGSNRTRLKSDVKKKPTLAIKKLSKTTANRKKRGTSIKGRLASMKA